jgi:hypothetical protein
MAQTEDIKEPQAEDGVERERVVLVGGPAGLRLQPC